MGSTWHPLFVHFPIALLITAFVFDLAALVLRRPSLGAAALYTSVLGTLGAVAAYLTGEPAEEASEHLVGIEAVMERHEDLGKLLMAAAIALLAVRLLVIWRGWRDRVGAQAIVTALSLVVVGLVVATGLFGGKLVYEHGAGVAPVLRDQPAPAHERHD